VPPTDRRVRLLGSTCRRRAQSSPACVSVKLPRPVTIPPTIFGTAAQPPPSPHPLPKPQLPYEALPISSNPRRIPNESPEQHLTGQHNRHLSSRQYQHRSKSHNQPPIDHHAPAPGAIVKVKPCGCSATLTPLVAVARLTRRLRRKCHSMSHQRKLQSESPTAVTGCWSPPLKVLDPFSPLPALMRNELPDQRTLLSARAMSESGEIPSRTLLIGRR
jgi:hypothetical protein